MAKKNKYEVNNQAEPNKFKEEDLNGSNSGETYVENAHASGDGSFMRSDEEALDLSVEQENKKQEDEY